MNKKRKLNKTPIIKPVAADEATDLVLSSMSEDGYLLATDEEMLAAARTATANDIRDAITRIRQLGPPGIGYRTLRECLLAQLWHRLTAVKSAKGHAFFLGSPKKLAVQAKLALEVALYIVDKHLRELHHADKSMLIRKWALEWDRPEALIEAAIECILNLNPRPGHPCPGIAAMASASKYLN